MDSVFLKKVINRIIMRGFSISKIPCADRIVYLTFDDGPEDGITEFVLDELDKYGFKATFFCKGQCACSHEDLIRKIEERGHRIGNHTYSHYHAYEIDGDRYIEDVFKADGVLHSILFRPPNGCLTLFDFLKLRKRFKIIYWSIGSGDWRKQENLNYNECLEGLKQTKSGDIILFHFCKELESGTRKLLPPYLQWLNENGYKSEIIKY